jgi:hypothetical protein
LSEDFVGVGVDRKDPAPETKIEHDFHEIKGPWTALSTDSDQGHALRFHKVFHTAAFPKKRSIGALVRCTGMPGPAGILHINRRQTRLVSTSREFMENIEVSPFLRRL